MATQSSLRRPKTTSRFHSSQHIVDTIIDQELVIKLRPKTCIVFVFKQERYQSCQLITVGLIVLITRHNFLHGEKRITLLCRYLRSDDISSTFNLFSISRSSSGMSLKVKARRVIQACCSDETIAITPL